MASLHRAGLVGLCIGALALSGVESGRSPAASVPSAPASLRETGLYTDFPARVIDPRNLPYSPQYPLWSDGAAKRRWIYIPPAATIDAADPDVWLFPAGVKIWKEFSFHDRPVETRLMVSLGEGHWLFSSYAWSAEGTDALLVPDAGLRDVVEIAPGVWHDIPGVRDCEACHKGARQEALGFSALQLSPDRDALAPHAEAVTPEMVNLEALMARGLIRHAPSEWKDHPPRIDAPAANARAVLGYLHANCGQCHNPGNNLGTASMLLRHSVAPSAQDQALAPGSAERALRTTDRPVVPATEEPAVHTTVGRPAGGYRLPDAGPGETLLVRPGDAERSALYFRMATRNPVRQMPPLGTEIVDTVAVAQVARWIREDLTAGPGSSGEVD